MGGDLIQILPVIPRGNKAMVVNATQLILTMSGLHVIHIDTKHEAVEDKCS